MASSRPSLSTFLSVLSNAPRFLSTKSFRQMTYGINRGISRGSRHNPDETYVTNPDGDLLDSLLDSRRPKAGVTMDPGDPSTYDSEPIYVPDYPATGKPWPVALFDLLEPNGF